MPPIASPSTTARWPVVNRWSKISAVFATVTATLLAGALTTAPVRVYAAPTTLPVALGAAEPYSVLSSTYVINTPSAPDAPHTIVRGNLGVSSMGRISGFPPGEVTGQIHYSDSLTTAAQLALGAAFADAANRPLTARFDGDLRGQTLSPGVYHSSTAVSNSGVLWLDGGGDTNAVFILQAGSSLGFGVGSEVRLINGAQATRVFWQVNGSVTIGAGAAVVGTVMSQNGISIGAGAVIDGRVLSRYAGISMNNNFVDITPSIKPTRFTAIGPERLADTRSMPNWYSPIAVGKVLRVRVARAHGVPADAVAAALNVTAVSPSATGFLTVYPCTATIPNVSTVNFEVGHDVANSTIATLANDGYVCVYASVPVNVVIDITGWFSPVGAAQMSPTTPHRLADTRSGLGGFGRLPAGGMLIVDTGEPDASAVALNVTAVGAAAAGYLTVYACGTRPNISTVNFAVGEARSNNAIVATGSGGAICVFASAAVDVIVDVTATFSATGQLDYVPASPVRLLDTRPNNMTEAGARIQFGTPRSGLATYAVSVSVTAIGVDADGYTTAFNCDAALPNASTVNQRVGDATANGAIVAVGDEMVGCLFTSSTAHLIVDLNGWWVSASN